MLRSLTILILAFYLTSGLSQGIQDTVFWNDYNLDTEIKLVQLESQKLELENKYNLEVIKRQKLYLLVSSLGLLLISIFTYLFYSSNRHQTKLNNKLQKQRDQIDMLNFELNHRVKNNLAFMTSLLQMQGRRTDSTETKQLLKESENRLRALSLVHANLNQEIEDFSINLKTYLEEIVSHLQSIFDIPNKQLRISSSFVNFTMDAENAMRIGIIVNELVTNSIKHAFANIEDPEISITTLLNIEGKLTLNYSDNGDGSKEDLGQDSKGSLSKGSMGIKLIDTLKKQLGPEIIIYSSI